MRKIRLANKILIGIVTTASVATVAAVCFTANKIPYDPLMFQDEVNVRAYTNGNERQSDSFISFPHNYHSMDFKYQKLYWVDVTRENVKDLVYKNSAFEVAHKDTSDTPDVTQDRFNNLFYPKNTIISLYDKNATNEGDAYTGTGEFADYSVLTKWSSQNGFAYISEYVDVPFDTESERTAYKNSHTLAEYNAMVEYYDKANTFLNVFAGSREVAQYFFSGVNYMSNGGAGHGLKKNETLNGEVISIENAKLTKSSIIKFADWLIWQSTSQDIVLDLSQLYLKDLDRDNSILALLNPQLWDTLITYMQSQSKQISKIDLSYNNLRVVPNIASIRNKTDDDWYWHELQVEGHAAMNNVYYEAGILEEINQDGYFDGIDLSHNSLTYYDFNAFNNYADKEAYLIDPADGINRTPSLSTLVKCRYDSYEDVYDVDVITEPWTLKPKEDKLIGVNLDYNHLTWIMMNPLAEFTHQHPVWWMSMLDSWPGLKLKDIPFIGESLPDYVLSSARAFLTYSTSITRSNILDGVIPMLEYALGLGAYQNDAVNYTSKEIYNYIMNNADDYGKKLMANKSSNQVTNAEIGQLYNKYIEKFITTGKLLSCPLNMELVDIDLFKIKPRFVTWQNASDSIGGIVYTEILWGFARTKYLPEELIVDDSTSLNDIATKLFNCVAINYHTMLEVPGFVKDYSAAIGVGVGLGVFALAIIVIAVIKLITNVKHQFEYRENELNSDLNKENKKK